jgi:integrase
MARPKDDDKKTANGLGSVDQLPSGKWRWRVTTRAAGGKTARVSGTEKSETVAWKALNRALTDAERGLLKAPDRVTLAEFAKTWLEQQTGLRPNTRRNYESELSYAFKVIGHMRVRDVRPEDIQALIASLTTLEMKAGSQMGKPMSARTINMVRARLHSVFSWAVMNQLIYLNPVAATKPVKVNHEVEDDGIGKALETDQATRLRELGECLNDAGVSRLWVAVLTCLTIGLRRGECMGLRWQDVDLKAGVIRIRQNLTTLEGQILMSKPKTAKATRDIPIPPSLRTALESHLAKHQNEWKACGAIWSNSLPVFATIEGTYTHPANLDRALKGIVHWSNPNFKPKDRKREGVEKRVLKVQHTNLERRLKAIPVEYRARLESIIRDGDTLPNISPHDLRHTAATLMLQRNMPVEVVSKVLGHATISITMNVYRHVSKRELELKMIDLFDTPIPARVVKAVVMN